MKKLLLAATMLAALASGAKAELLGGIEWTLAGADVLTVSPNGTGAASYQLALPDLRSEPAAATDRVRIQPVRQSREPHHAAVLLDLGGGRLACS